MFSTLSKHTLKTKGCGLCTNIITIDERRVAKHGWFLAKEFFNLSRLFLNIEGKSLFISQ